MRDFFIRGLEMIVNVVVVLMCLGVVLVAVAAFTGMGQGYLGPDMQVGSGALAGLLVLIGGGLYVVFVGGLMYLGIGIYQNTKRMADALDRRG